MTPRKAEAILTALQEKFQARCDRLCLEERITQVYNLAAIGINLLYDAAEDGSQPALKALESIAEQAVQAGGKDV